MSKKSQLLEAAKMGDHATVQALLNCEDHAEFVAQTTEQNSNFTYTRRPLAAEGEALYPLSKQFIVKWKPSKQHFSNKWDDSPMHQAIANGDVALVRILYGNDFFCASQCGKQWPCTPGDTPMYAGPGLGPMDASPLWLAICLRQYEIAEIIINAFKPHSDKYRMYTFFNHELPNFCLSDELRPIHRDQSISVYTSGIDVSNLLKIVGAPQHIQKLFHDKLMELTSVADRFTAAAEAEEVLGYKFDEEGSPIPSTIVKRIGKADPSRSFTDEHLQMSGRSSKAQEELFFNLVRSGNAAAVDAFLKRDPKLVLFQKQHTGPWLYQRLTYNGISPSRPRDGDHHMLAIAHAVGDSVWRNRLGQWNETVLHMAITEGQLHIVKMILSMGRDSISEQPVLEERCGPMEMTPLALAVWLGQEEIALYLIDRGANVNAVTERVFDPRGIQAMYDADLSVYHIASLVGSSDRLKEALRSAGANLTYRAKYIPRTLGQAHSAACSDADGVLSNGFAGCVTLGLWPCISAICASDDPTQFMDVRKIDASAELLYKRARMRASEAGSLFRSHSSMSTSSSSQQVITTQPRATNPPDPLKVHTHSNYEDFFAAIKQLDYDRVRYYLDMGLNPNHAKLVERTLYFDRSAHGIDAGQTMILHRTQKTRELVNYYAKFTPLSVAICDSNIPSIEVLEATVESRATWEREGRRRLAMVELLLNYGAHLEDRANSNTEFESWQEWTRSTPLMLATLSRIRFTESHGVSSKEQIAALLIRRGADVNAVNETAIAHSGSVSDLYSSSGETSGDRAHRNVSILHAAVLDERDKLDLSLTDESLGPQGIDVKIFRTAALISLLIKHGANLNAVAEIVPRQPSNRKLPRGRSISGTDINLQRRSATPLQTAGLFSRDPAVKQLLRQSTEAAPRVVATNAVASAAHSFS